jgi:threonine dehydratase
MTDPAGPSAITAAAVRAAADTLRGHVLRTPTLPSSAEDGAPLVLKAESLQHTGSFKFRGATNRILALPPDCPGVVAHSSGNHAQAVARAARLAGVACTVVMPDDAPPLKRRRTEAEGALVVDVGPDSAERAERASQLAAEHGLVLVEPFDDPLVASGQGTAGLELLEDAPLAIERFYAPVSGGGLMAGCAAIVADRSPRTEIIGVEPAAGDDTRRSLAAGERRSVPPPETIADGLRVRTPGAVTFPVLQHTVSRIETVTDDELRATMRWAASHLRLVLEPSGAAALAVARREGGAAGGVILSGGNVDPATFAEILASPAPDRTRGR